MASYGVMEDGMSQLGGMGAMGGLAALNPYLLGLGAAGSIAGGIFGGASQNRAGRKARDYAAARQGEAFQRNAGSVFGNADFMNLIRGSQGNAGAADAFTKSIGGPVLQQRRNLATKYAGAGQDLLGSFDAQSAGLKQGGQQNLGWLLGMLSGDTGGVMDTIDAGSRATADMYRQGSNALLGSYDKGAGGLMRTVKNYGKGREDIIRKDAGKALTDAQGASAATLAAGGFGGSTAAAVTNAGNVRASNDAVQKQLADLGDAQTDREVGLGRSLLSERSGMANNLFSQSANALTGFTRDRNAAAEAGAGRRGAAATAYTQDQAGRDYARAGQRSALEVGNLERNAGNDQMTLAEIMQAINSGSYGGGNTSAYYPGYSAAGTALTNGGNALGGLASYLMLTQALKSA